jgi:ABC-2 type transport system ATP-binding protein
LRHGKQKGVLKLQNIISMKNIRKDFKGNTALKNLTFDIKEGEIFGFLGPSGAGKTTTIKLLTSQLLPTSGEVKVFGKDVYTNKKEICKNIGILSDTSGIYDRLSVGDNLMLYANINGIPKESVEEILEKVGMLEDIKKEAKKLSKGMKQRLMIARAVIHKPKLLFLDEPTSSLDPGTTLEIHRLLRRLNEEGTTIFLTTHNMEEADKLCDRVAFLNDGEIVDIGKPNDLKLKYTNDDIKVILKDENKEIMLKNNKEGASRIKTWMEEGQLLAIHSMEPSLEKIFLNLTGREL